jgi:hypothetical protein
VRGLLFLFVLNLFFSASAQNIAPFAIGSERATNAGQPIIIDLGHLSIDVDNDVLTYSVVDNDEIDGVVGVNNDTRTLTFTPDHTFSGITNLVFVANDGIADSNPATITVDVREKPNLSPVAYNDHYSLKTDSSLALVLNGHDPEGDSNLTYGLITETQNGLVSLNPKSGYVTYTPNTGFYGDDRFVYYIEDSAKQRSQESSIELTVRQMPNNTPNGNPFSVSLNQNESVQINLTGYDSDGDNLVFKIEKNASNGIVSINEKGVGSYIPIEGFYGNDSFVFSVTDGKDTSYFTNGVLSVIKIKNNPPIGFNSTSTIGYNSFNVFLQPKYEDIEDDTITTSIYEQAKNGEVTITDSSFSYTPKTNYFGSDLFIYKLNDGTFDSEPISKFINIIGPGDLNSDGNINSLDLIFIASHIVGIRGYEMPATYDNVFDVNNDQNISLLDIIHLASSLIGIEGFDLVP